MKKEGKIKTEYKELEKNGDLAELIGVILGDGHIGIFPRTEALLIFSNSNNQGFVNRYSAIVEKLFDKKPAVRKMSKKNCTRICIYEKNISKRLGIPKGARKNKKFSVPNWILKDKRFVVRYLRGLFEAEGSFCVHRPTCTYKLFFSNRNKSLLSIVSRLLRKLGFKVNVSGDKVQVSRKKEVFDLVKLLEFRKY
jgi:DNA-binding transcriptional regulator WhiA